MKCGGCVSQVKGLLERQPSVTMATVNLATETALVRVVLPGCDSGADSVPRRLQELGEQLAMVSAGQVPKLVWGCWPEYRCRGCSDWLCKPMCNISCWLSLMLCAVDIWVCVCTHQCLHKASLTGDAQQMWLALLRCAGKRKQ